MRTDSVPDASNCALVGRLVPEVLIKRPTLDSTRGTARVTPRAVPQRPLAGGPVDGLGEPNGSPS